MKRYTDIEPATLAAMTDEEIATLIELEVACEGIMPAIKPKAPTVEDVNIKQTVEAYKVGDRYFMDEEHAVTAARLSSFQADYDYQAGGYDYKWLKPIKEQAWEKVWFYTHEDVLRVREALQMNKEKQDAFDEDDKEYKAFMCKTGVIRNDVWEAVTVARKAIAEQEAALVQMEKYRTLAGGDEEIAKKFFRDAYKDRPELIKHVLGEDAEPEEAPNTDEERNTE